MSCSCATKESARRRSRRAAEPFRRACAAHGALFVLNDRPDLVDRCGADGVHVGQGDVSLLEARRAVGAERLVGLSASTVDELQGDPRTTSVSAQSSARRRNRSRCRRARARPRCARRLRIAVVRDRRHRRATRSTRSSPRVLPGVAVVRAIRDAADPEAAARALRRSATAVRRIVAHRRQGDSLLPQIDWLEGSLHPAQIGARPHTHRGACRRLLRPRQARSKCALGEAKRVRVPAGSCVGGAAAVSSTASAIPGGDRGALPQRPCAWRAAGERGGDARSSRRRVRHVLRRRCGLGRRARDHQRPGRRRSPAEAASPCACKSPAAGSRRARVLRRRRVRRCRPTRPPAARGLLLCPRG